MTDYATQVILRAQELLGNLIRLDLRPDMPAFLRLHFKLGRDNRDVDISALEATLIETEGIPELAAAKEVI